MKNLIYFLLYFFMAAGIANASGISIETDSGLNPATEMSIAVNKQEPTLAESPRASQISLQTIAVPPATWVVGFGLCLVFLGYMIKNKAH